MSVRRAVVIVMVGAIGVAAVGVAAAWLAGAIGDGSNGGNPPAVSTEIAEAPNYPLFDHTLTSTGDDVIVIGGAGGDMTDGLLVDDPLAWNPTDGLRSISSPPGPVRNRHTAVWTGDEVFIWSGSTVPYGVGDGLLPTTQLYNPATDTWRQGADSPDALGRTSGRGAFFDGFVLVTGGTTPRSDDAGTVGVYEVATDTWTMIGIPGTALTVAATGNAAYLLWVDNEDRPVLSRLDPETGNIHDLDVPPLPAGANRSTVIAVGDRLVLWVEARAEDVGGTADAVVVLVLDDDGAVAADPDAAIDWRQLDVDIAFPGSALGYSSIRPLVHTDEWLAFTEGVDLRWVRISDGLQIDRSITTPQSCALRTRAVGTSQFIVAWGGECVLVDEDGSEEQIVGHFVFEPPETTQG